MASSFACPKCLQPVIPIHPFGGGNDRQLEVPVAEWHEGCRQETVVKGEGRYAQPVTRYYARMWECSTPSCPKRGGIHEHHLLREVSAKQERQRQAAGEE